MNANDVLNISPVVPVITIDNAKDALPLAKVIYASGIKIMEITLRTQAALEAIEIISKNMPEMNVGAGTVCSVEDFENAIKVNAKFVFSPGISQDLIDISKKKNIPFIPGVSTSSEVMLAQNNGIFACKLFPAVLSGGVGILKAFSSPFSKMKFCPTGGVNLDNLDDFLSLKNVSCVGGTWICPKELINQNNFKEIEILCKQAYDKALEIKNKN